MTLSAKKENNQIWPAGVKPENGSYFSLLSNSSFCLLLSDKAYPILGFRALVSRPTGC